MARAFFLIGAIGFSVVFPFLTLDTICRMPEQNNAANSTPQAIAGKHLALNSSAAEPISVFLTHQ